MAEAPKAEPVMLTVVVADTAPVQYLNEPAGHRTVHVALTEAQCASIALGENEIYSTAYLEPLCNAEARRG